MKFVTEIWHPNIEKNGDVCISILHEPGDDKWGYEKASERWLPVHTVETILISVISMLADPNDESPGEWDKMLRGWWRGVGAIFYLSIISLILIVVVVFFAILSSIQPTLMQQKNGENHTRISNEKWHVAFERVRKSDRRIIQTNKHGEK